MIPHQKYLQPLRKTIAQLAISTSTIAFVLSVLAPVNALAATFTMQFGTADNFDTAEITSIEKGFKKNAFQNRELLPVLHCSDLVSLLARRENVFAANKPFYCRPKKGDRF